MTDFERYSLWVQVGGTVSTFLAVIVALFGEHIRRLWTRPKLTIALADPSLTITEDRRRGWYYQLRVENTRSFYTATNVQVQLTRIFKRGSEGFWEEEPFSDPVPVTWRWPAHQPVSERIGPASKYATFGYVLEDSQAFRLQLYIYPNNLHPEIPKGEPTMLAFEVVSDTARSDPIWVEVVWDGEWVAETDEMQKHLAVKQVVTAESRRVRGI